MRQPHEPTGRRWIAERPNPQNGRFTAQLTARRLTGRRRQAEAEFVAVAGRELAERQQQEARVDAKAAGLAGVTGVAATVAVTLLGGQDRVGGWALLALVPVAAAALLWTCAMVWLLLRVLRPTLVTSQASGSFLDDEQAGALAGVSEADYLRRRLQLGGLLARRYRALRAATNLFVAGIAAAAVGALAYGALAVAGVI